MQDGFSESFCEKLQGLATVNGGLMLDDVHKSSDGTQKLVFRVCPPFSNILLVNLIPAAFPSLIPLQPTVYHKENNCGELLVLLGKGGVLARWQG